MPIIDGGSKITNYIIEKRESTRKAYAAVITHCETCSIRVSDLAEGLEYYFRVSAENEYGIGEAVETPDPIRVSQAPTPPENVTFTDVTKHTVRLAWTKPKHDGGSRVTGYVIEAQKKGTDQWAHVTTVKSLDFTVKNLNENEEYIFRVMAVNSSGRSFPRVSKPVVIKEQNSEPEFDLRGVCQKIVIAKAGEDIKVEVPVSGRPKPTVSWQKDNQALKLTQRTMIENTSTSTILIINECLRSDSGIYSMTGKNIVGSVTDSITVKVHDLPGPPKGPIKLDKISRTFIEFSWEAPENDGGVPINNYIVEIRETTSQTWVELSSLIIRTTFKATRLTTGIEYQFRVKAKNRYGTGPPLMSEAVVAAYPFKVPGPPGTPKVVTFTKDTMTIGWNEPVSDGGSEVIGYHVERKERNSIVWHRISKALVIGNLFKSTGLEDGVAYEFRVIAENIAGIGKPSKASEPMLALDPVDPPGQPVPIHVSKNAITIQWTKPEYDGGFKITGYTVEKRDLSAGRWMRANFTNIIETTFTISGLTQDESYEFRVLARNSAGAVSNPSDPSDPIISKLADGGQYTLLLKNPGGEKTVQVNICVLDKPGPPEGSISITGVTSEHCCLSWKPPKQDGGSKITHYIVERRETSRLLWTVVEPKVQALNLKIMKLLEGNEYIFRVFPVNKFGVGEPLQSSAVVIKNPFTPPDAAKGVEVSNVKKDSMVITWEAPTNDGGTPITGYIIEKHDKEGIRWTRCNMKTVTNLTFKVNGLLETHRYEFRVSAENAAGVSEASSATVFYKALDPVFKPGPPLNPKVLDMTKSSVVLAWGKPIYDGGCEIQGYIVEAFADEWTMCTPPAGVKLTRFNVENLKEKQEYKFRVCAVNKVGVGEHADVAGPILPEDKTEEPDLDIDAEFRKLVRIKAGGSLRMFIPFKGRPTPQIKWEKDGGQIKETAQTETTSSHTSLVIDKVNRADSGKYTVTAENSAGTKSETIIVKVLDTPSAPINFKVKEITKESVTLTWEPPSLDGGAKIKNYIVEKRESTRKTFSAVVTNCHKLSWKVEPLQEGCSYYFRVLAENEHGIGLPADITDPLKVSEVPQCPGKLSVVDVTKTSVSLSWEKPIHDGGSRILQYLVEMQVKGNDKWSGCANVKTLEAVISNLNPGEEYTFKVIAINEKGKSDPRTLAVPVQAKDLVFGPDVRPVFSNYSVLVGKDLQVEIPVSGRPKPKVTWTKDGAALKFTTRVNISNKAHSTVLSIKEAAREDGGMYGINVSNAVGQKDATIEIITLDKPGVEYEFRVYAENIVGIGRCSKISEGFVARDPCDPPETPEAVHVTKNSITIQWTKPEYDGGSVITGYTVEKRDLPEGRWMKASFTNVIETNFTVTGLTEGAKYDFRVIAKNAVGTISKPSYNSGPIAAL
uniref:Titin n=1 Tax=Sinocyclocheilus grahami TaxID=75366 RepID=A0A672P2R7_SINGR